MYHSTAQDQTGEIVAELVGKVLFFAHYLALLKTGLLDDVIPEF